MQIVLYLKLVQCKNRIGNENTTYWIVSVSISIDKSCSFVSDAPVIKLFFILRFPIPPEAQP